jgi:hypothetical protein
VTVVPDFEAVPKRVRNDDPLPWVRLGMGCGARGSRFLSRDAFVVGVTGSGMSTMIFSLPKRAYLMNALPRSRP